MRRTKDMRFGPRRSLRAKLRRRDAPSLTRKQKRTLGTLVLVAFIIPIFLAYVPILSPLFAGVSAMTTAFGIDTGNTTLNGMMPFFEIALVFVVGWFVVFQLLRFGEER
jgi:hypothetical protein